MIHNITLRALSLGFILVLAMPLVAEEEFFKKHLPSGVRIIPPHSPTPIPALAVHGAAGAKANSLQT